jgi:hypothetical protein
MAGLLRTAKNCQLPLSNGARREVLRDLRTSGRRLESLTHHDPLELFGRVFR